MAPAPFWVAGMGWCHVTIHKVLPRIYVLHPPQEDCSWTHTVGRLMKIFVVNKIKMRRRCQQNIVEAQYLIENCTKTTYQTLKLRNAIVFENYMLILNLMLATSLKKVRYGSYLSSRCVISFNNTCKGLRLGNKETKCCSLKVFSLSCFLQDVQLLNNLGTPLSYCVINKTPNIFSGWQVRTANRSV